MPTADYNDDDGMSHSPLGSGPEQVYVTKTGPFHGRIGNVRRDHRVENFGREIQHGTPRRLTNVLNIDVRVVHGYKSPFRPADET